MKEFKVTVDGKDFVDRISESTGGEINNSYDSLELSIKASEDGDLHIGFTFHMNQNSKANDEGAYEHYTTLIDLFSELGVRVISEEIIELD